MNSIEYPLKSNLLTISNNNFRKFLFIIGFTLNFYNFDSHAQLIINEGSNKNYTQVTDEDGENEDWFEIFNTSGSTVNIEGWSITDNDKKIDKWVFPSINISPETHLLVFASDKDRRIYTSGGVWESPVLPTDLFSYLIPDASTSTDWNTAEFDVTEWETGQAGFGYGDDDDSTIFPEGTLVAYVRKSFNVSNINAIGGAACHIDYDDGFIAYLNGIEICRSNITGTPSWNSIASGLNDPTIEDGSSPEEFLIDNNLLSSALQEGENIFAIEIHNRDINSSDLTLIPYLSFSIINDESYFSDSPEWVTTSSNGQLHTNFKISSDGETLYLYNAEQQYVDSLVVDITSLDHSVGHATDGDGVLALFNEATPGASNNTSTAYIEGYEEAPDFNQNPGFYTNAISVILTTSSTDAEIRYTTDGSQPTESSQLYNGSSISVSQSVTINAKTFSSTGKLSSQTSTATYFIGEDFTVPVLSVTTDNNNLYGSDGIFTNWRESWNRPCYVEYFETDGTLAFKQKAGIQVDGGAGGSRSHAQHSFRIEPGNGTFGEGDLKYSLHPDRPDRDSYSSFYLRNGSNQYLILPYKDALQVKSMGQNSHNYYSAFRPVVVFINGGYFGMYELREKINADYLKQNYNMDTDSIDIIGISFFKGRQLEAIEGSTDQYLIDRDTFDDLDPSDTDYLEQVDQFLDLDNYTDYMIAQSWIANTDWPTNNIKIFRTPNTGYRWQFALIDLEWSFLPHEWSTAEFDHIQYLLDEGSSQLITGFWYGLMQNETYKNRFINRFADLMNTNYDFSVIGPLEQSMYNEVQPEMTREYEKWGTSDITGQMSEFAENHVVFRSELEKRSSFVKDDLRQHYGMDEEVSITLNMNIKKGGKIKINTISPENYPWTGTYFSDIPLGFEAIPNPGYTFTGWEPNSMISNTDEETFTTEITTSTVTFTATFELNEEPFTDITITEINYKDGDDFNTTDWFEIYNGTATALSLNGWYFSDNDETHRYDFDPDVSIPANGYLVVVKNIDSFNENYPEVLNYTGEFDFGLSSNDDEIHLYNESNELVVEVIYSDSDPWPLNEDETGRTLELLHYTQELSNPLSWIAGCVEGSPGKVYEESCGTETGTTLDTPGQNIGLNEISVYPIPTSEEVNLKFRLENNEQDLQINIHNMLGKLLKTESIGHLPSGDQKITLDISDLGHNQILVLSLVTSQGQKFIKIIKE